MGGMLRLKCRAKRPKRRKDERFLHKNFDMIKNSPIFVGEYKSSHIITTCKQTILTHKCARREGRKDEPCGRENTFKQSP